MSTYTLNPDRGDSVVSPYEVVVNCPATGSSRTAAFRVRAADDGEGRGKPGCGPQPAGTYWASTPAEVDGQWRDWMLDHTDEL